MPAITTRILEHAVYVEGAYDLSIVQRTTEHEGRHVEHHFAIVSALTSAGITSRHETPIDSPDAVHWLIAALTRTAAAMERVDTSVAQLAYGEAWQRMRGGEETGEPPPELRGPPGEDIPF